MKKFLRESKLLRVLALAILVCTFLPQVHAAITAPVLVLIDGAGNGVQIDGTGAITYIGTCTSATCGGAGAVAVAPGQITFNHAIDAFTVNVTTGLTNPAIAYPELEDLNSVNVQSAGGAGFLDIFFGNTGFMGAGGFQLAYGGTTATGSTATITAYDDTANSLTAANVYGTTGAGSSMIATSGAQGPGAFSGTKSGAAAASSPYSLTEQLHLVFSASGGTDSGDFALNAVPEPASVALLGGVLLFAVGAIRRKVRRA